MKKRNSDPIILTKTESNINTVAKMKPWPMAGGQYVRSLLKIVNQCEKPENDYIIQCGEEEEMTDYSEASVAIDDWPEICIVAVSINMWRRKYCNDNH